MTEKDFYQTLLTLTKNGTDLYLHATTEASTPVVYDTFKYSLTKAIDHNHEIYKKMESLGWYKVKPVEAQKVYELENKISNTFSNW